MRNLNVNLSMTAANNLLVESTCTTPRTPEILNSLIAMTSPLENYTNSQTFNGNHSTLKELEENTIITTNLPSTANLSSDSNSSSSSQTEGSQNGISSICGGTSTTPSIQHTCSQLIKAGLKLSIEQKRKQMSDCEDLLDLDKCPKRIKKNDCSESEEDKHKQDGLTPEDEERRRRRRERNKIAATKCRLKKRERTANLVNESETLETQNVDLKNQLQELQNQKRSLFEILARHRPQCKHNITPATRDALYMFPPSPTASTAASVLFNQSDCYTSYVKTMTTAAPAIVVDEIDTTSSDYRPQLTDLDTTHTYDAYTEPCHPYGGTPNYGNASGCMA